jgi:hypothetical protein
MKSLGRFCPSHPIRPDFGRSLALSLYFIARDPQYLILPSFLGFVLPTPIQRAENDL